MGAHYADREQDYSRTARLEEENAELRAEIEHLKEKLAIATGDHA